jgi:hypothetical protein
MLMDIYNEYVEEYNKDPFSDNTIELGECLIDSIGEERQRAWQEMVESTDLTHNSKKAWNMIRKLSSDKTSQVTATAVTANQIAKQLLDNGRSARRRPAGEYKQLKLPKHLINHESVMPEPFCMDELKTALSQLKNSKAAGLDDILAEFLKHLGPIATKWLLELFDQCRVTQMIPKMWRKARIIAIPKPDKDPNIPKNFRPISLLSITYKLYEQMILGHINPIIDGKLIAEQSGFRPGRSCASQLLNLIQTIEDGFQRKLTTGAAFVDLSTAYDTVQHRSLISKLYNITKDTKLCLIIRSLLENRRFYVDLNGQRSRWRTQRNGLPQGSVLAPLLFNVYTNNQPLPTGCKRFLYADDLCLTTTQKNLSNIKETLESALHKLSAYYKKSDLKPNPCKTQVSLFHLDNHKARATLNMTWEGQQLEHETHPRYLGVTRDHTLSYKQHCLNTKAKVSAHNNIMRKLTCSKWGANPDTLRITALALCMSTAEYACLTWARSSHARHVDTALNDTCRIITGSIKSAPTHCLYALAGICPPDIRRTAISNRDRAIQQTTVTHYMDASLRATDCLPGRVSSPYPKTVSTILPASVKPFGWRDGTSCRTTQTWLLEV